MTDKEKPFIEDPVKTLMAKEITCFVKGTQVKLSDAQFLSPKVISLKIDDVTSKYISTQTYFNITYFQCENRQKGERTNKKCLAKIHYNRDKNSVSLKISIIQIAIKKKQKSKLL